MANESSSNIEKLPVAVSEKEPTEEELALLDKKVREEGGRIVAQASASFNSPHLA